MSRQSTQHVPCDDDDTNHNSCMILDHKCLCAMYETCYDTWNDVIASSDVQSHDGDVCVAHDYVCMMTGCRCVV